MNRFATAATSALVACSFLAACSAKPPPDIAYNKIGASKKRLHSDSQSCWAQAQSARAPKEVETAQAIGTILGAGVVGVAVLMASKAAEDADPKNVYRRNAHGVCMKKLGYKAIGFLPATQPTEKKANRPKTIAKTRRTRIKKRPQCYTFNNCVNLCRDGNMPGISVADAYCSEVCTNKVNLC